MKVKGTLTRTSHTASVSWVMDAKKLPLLLGLTVLTTVISTGSVAEMTLEAAVGQYMPVSSTLYPLCCSYLLMDNAIEVQYHLRC